MATAQWTPFGVTLDLTATAGTVTRKSATEYTVVINVSWATHWNTDTNYGLTATSGGASVTLNKFGTYSDAGSGKITGTFSISGNGSATKSISVVFKNFNTDNGDSATKTINLSVSVPAWTYYTIKYNANGGSGEPSSQMKWKDQTLILSSTKPTRTGYTFLGWSTSSSATSATYTAGGSYRPNAAATLYAVWSPYTYSVKYDANGGSGEPSNQVKTYDDTLTLSSTKPTRENYEFLGWATTASATVATYAAGGTYTANKAVTLYAVWKLIYTKPRVTDPSISRCDSNGTILDDGTCALVNFDWECDRTISSIVIAWETTTGIADSTSVEVSGTRGSVKEIIGSEKMSAESTYSFTITVTDENGYTVVFGTLSGTAFAIDFLAGGLGAAFGKPAELLGVLDIKWQTRHLGGLLPVVLEPETDLDTVLIPNTYIGENVSTYNYANCPVSSGTFTLLVESCGEAGQIKQTYTSCSKFKPERYSRFYYQGEWEKDTYGNSIWSWANTDEYVLYENDSGSNGTITLNANLSHFRYIEIYFTDNNNKTGGYTKVYKPDGKTISLNIVEAGSTVYSRQTLYVASGTTLTPTTATSSYFTVGTSDVTLKIPQSLIKIVRVIGRA